MDDGPVSLSAQQNIDIALEEPVAPEVSQAEFDDTYGLDTSIGGTSEDIGELVESIDLSDASTGPEEVDLFLEEEEGIQELSIDLEDFDIEEPGSGPARLEESHEEEIVFDMDLPDSEAAQIEETPIMETSGAARETTLVDIESLSRDEPEILLEDEVFEGGAEPLDLGEVASAVEDEGVWPGLSTDIAEEVGPSFSEGAHIPHGDTMALEREFLGLDLELEPLEEGAGAPEPTPEQLLGDELILEEELTSLEGTATGATPLPDSTKADDDAALIDLDTLTVEEPEVTLEEEIFDDIEEPLDLGEVAAAVEEEFQDLGPSVVEPTEELLPPEDGAVLPHGDTMALDRELLGLDLDLEAPEEKSEIREPAPAKTPEDEIAPIGVDEPFKLGEDVLAGDEELKDLGPSVVEPTEELLPPEEGAFLPHGDTLALDRELLGLDLDLEPAEEPTEVIETRPEQAPQEKTAPEGLDASLDQKELAPPPLKEKPAQPVEGLSPDDTMALDLEALGLDLELETEERGDSKT
jgi:hypothetical protein